MLAILIVEWLAAKHCVYGVECFHVMNFRTFLNSIFQGRACAFIRSRAPGRRSLGLINQVGFFLEGGGGYRQNFFEMHNFLRRALFDTLMKCTSCVMSFYSGRRRRR